MKYVRVDMLIKTYLNFIRNLVLCIKIEFF